MRFPFSQSVFLTALCGVAFAPLASAITIRDDTPDSSYLTLGADPTYQAAGFFSGGSFGGTLITDPFGLNEYVVTATHLVEAGRIVAGSSTFTIGGNAYGVSAIFSAPGYNSSTQQNDLSVIRLSAPVTGVTPVQYYTGTAELNKTVTAIGYGFSGTGLTGGVTADSQRRGMNNVIDVLDASTISAGLPSTSYLFDFDNPSGTSNSLSLLNTGGKANSSASALSLEGSLAAADSGGGEFAMIGGTLYLVGVNSYIAAPSTNPDAANPDGHYGDIDGATRVSLFSEFIAQTVPEPGPAALLVGGLAVCGGLCRRRGGSVGPAR
ncbi:putative secreted protein with PEP-CTERM sorting signal [Chthoniobacter flavus]|nr:putative secreted protein with PEP-CTERM sorting signal [Chthoniobacter flavus]